MTLHSHTEYKCNYCDTYFVPLPIFRSCPKCGRLSEKVFNNFIEDTIRSAMYNLTHYGSFVPHGWATIDIGDHYYWLAFLFLYFVSSSLKVKQKDLFGQDISEKTAQKLASAFLDKINFGKQVYMAKALEIYFVRLLCSPRIDKVSKETQQKPSCFLSHCISDKVFCDKLYSDLVASGISCWYFPEDATLGRGIWPEINSQIRSCDKMIVVCSENSLHSAPVLREIERSLQREDVEGKDILIPIGIDNYILEKWDHPRKIDVISKVVGDFQSWKKPEKYRNSLRRLTNAIKS